MIEHTVIRVVDVLGDEDVIGKTAGLRLARRVVAALDKSTNDVHLDFSAVESMSTSSAAMLLSVVIADLGRAAIDRIIFANANGSVIESLKAAMEHLSRFAHSVSQ